VLTSRTKPSTTLVGRLATAEDPRDVYRVFVPAHGRITVKTGAAAAVDLGLWDPATNSVSERGGPGSNKLARGTTQGSLESLIYKNSGAAKTAYLAITLATGTRDATYRIGITAR
jgi:hypothetical protein